MPAELQAIADPRFILLAWASGLALVAGAVSMARIVGRGFTWLSAGTAGVVGLAGGFLEGAWAARLALLLLVAAVILAGNRKSAGLLLLTAGVAFLIEASFLGGWLLAATATLGLGGVTGEMLLGHWYLIDPRLPRIVLKALALVGIGGLVGDGVVLAAVGSLPTGGAVIAFWVLMGGSILLMAAVLGALRYPGYSGVMAATGLSYLAVLTTLGTVFLGRALVAGLGPFAI